MKKVLFLTLVFVSFANFAMADSFKFPEFNDFKKDGEVKVFDESNLYEYIDGAADGYIQAGFKKLTVQIYSKGEDSSFTIDVYEMKDNPSGFGIYKKEKSESEKVEIGNEGYYETGMLNFYKGKYYVKLSSFGLGDKDKSILTDAATNLAKILKVKKQKTMFDCFPKEFKVEKSEKYVGSDFLGHSFLHSAFTVNLNINSIEYSPFILKVSENEVLEITKKYKALLKRKNKKVEMIEKIMVFNDPYYRNVGKMYFYPNGKYVIGLFSKDKDVAIKIIKLIEKNIKNNFKNE